MNTEIVSVLSGIKKPMVSYKPLANFHIRFHKIYINEVSGIIRIECLAMFFYLPGNVVFKEFKGAEERVELFPFGESY